MQSPKTAIEAPDLQALLMKQEPLHEDLIPWLEHTPSGIHLKHPLYFSIFYCEQFNASINHGYAQKQAYLKRKEAEGNYMGCIFLYERPYRAEFFALYASRMSDQEYWEGLREVLLDTENFWQQMRTFRRLLKSKRPGHEYLMTEQSRQVLQDRVRNGDSKGITVYRGCDKRNERGFSWTLNGTVAKWFALRLKPTGQTAQVLVGSCKKSDIYAYFEERGEEEVLIEPSKVQIIRVDKVVKQ